MGEFTYTAHSKVGDMQSGTITASSKQAATDALKQKGLRPLVLKQKGSMEIKLPGSNRVKPKDLVVFTRQLSTMISAGVPILQALSTLREQVESKALRTCLEQVTFDVQSGSNLSDALGKHPKIFSEIYVNMVRAGEAGGILDQILSRLAMQVEKDSTIKSKFKGAMIYPGVVSAVAVIAVIFLMVGVIPKLTSILTESGAELPAQTKFIIFVSDTLINQWPYIVGALAIVVFAYRRYKRTPAGLRNIHRLQLRMPIFGNIIMKVNIARFSRTFSSLLGAGVSVIEALETTAGSLGNVVIRDALMDASKMIKSGKSISESLDASHILPQIIIQMASVGEETGQMDTVLTKVAEFTKKKSILSSIVCHLLSNLC